MDVIEARRPKTKPAVAVAATAAAVEAAAVVATAAVQAVEAAPAQVVAVVPVVQAPALVQEQGPALAVAVAERAEHVAPQMSTSW